MFAVILIVLIEPYNTYIILCEQYLSEFFLTNLHGVFETYDN